MQEFQTKAVIVFAVLLLTSAILGYLCLSRAFLQASLLPAGNGAFFWQTETLSDVDEGGSSQATIAGDKFNLNFNFTLTHQAKYPSAAIALVFKDRTGKPALVDLSAYDRLSFNVKCSPANIIMFSVYTLEDKVSVADKPLSYRAPATFFSCNENTAHLELDLTRLETPQWWLDMFKIALSKKEYRLDKVARITFGSSFQSPYNTAAQVQLDEVTLSGRNWRYAYCWAGFLLAAWGAYSFWFVRQHSRAVIAELRDKLQRDRPLVAYQQLSLEPHRDKDKSAILHFMATNYANPELNLEAMATGIGVSRTKINDVLKAELGFTFTSYLNKLRLTEAARLLAEKEDANIAEIAYSVGYKNVTYFNKLFKVEYGCTPKAFKSLCDRPPGDLPAN